MTDNLKTYIFVTCVSNDILNLLPNINCLDRNLEEWKTKAYVFSTIKSVSPSLSTLFDFWAVLRVFSPFLAPLARIMFSGILILRYCRFKWNFVARKAHWNQFKINGHYRELEMYLFIFLEKWVYLLKNLSTEKVAQSYRNVQM